MLTTNQLRQIAFRTGARDLANIEIEVLLTYILQLFHEHGLHEHLAFKGGTMLRKMVFGSRGRLSTDLDFTRRSDISVDDLAVMMLDALAQPYHGIAFRFDRDRDWYLTDDGCATNPVCSHEENQPGIKVKLQVSTRERPILPVEPRPQIAEDYFKLLPFAVAEIPCLRLSEIIAEKIRAASQRSKIRDLHDLAEVSGRPLERDLIRTLAVLKLWNTGGPGLDFERFRERIQDRRNYDIGDLQHLLRRGQNPDLEALIRQVVDGYQFLGTLTELEQVVAADQFQRRRDEAAQLIASIV
ncbi:MAG TPA: nucleotidyl transferase AbiEii/AbiGii toxin family protein [Pyrinomonadaceae bacterium]|nr:nucleotidyl transferase AbiEii/AbiGii toxin family protein [Pyrinomonadaceae bacterium]